MDDKKLWATVGTLTLAEKAALCSGASAWLTKALPEKGIPALLMADGSVAYDTLVVAAGSENSFLVHPTKA